jgi:hypothetical protein
VYHVELKQHSEVARAFNLSEDELRQGLLEPLTRGGPFRFADRDWDAGELTPTILEGRRLRPGELVIGLGWPNAFRLGTDVTDPMLAAVRAEAQRREAVQRLSERILGRIGAGPLELTAAVAVADDLLAGHSVSERFATTAQAAWELLQRQRAELVDAAGAPIDPDQWQQVLLGWASASGDQATTSAISLKRSESDANR